MNTLQPGDRLNWDIIYRSKEKKSFNYLVVALCAIVFTAMAMPERETATGIEKQLTDTVFIEKEQVLNKVLTFEEKFIKRYLPIAQKEKELYGIPVSIKLGQAILESDYGRAKLVKKANNYFGIKCHSKKCKKGHCVNRSDDHHKDYFRKYDTAWASFRDHSKKLQEKRYQHLQDCEDYVCWAEGLQKAGYATDKKYPKKLIDIIDRYDLHIYD